MNNYDDLKLIIEGFPADKLPAADLAAWLTAWESNKETQEGLVMTSHCVTGPLGEESVDYLKSGNGLVIGLVIAGVVAVVGGGAVCYMRKKKDGDNEGGV